VTTYGVLGVGSIGQSIVTGLCEGVQDPPDVVLSPRNASRARGLADQHASVCVARDNQAVVDASDVVLLCLLPGHVGEVLNELTFRKGQAMVSAMAGVPVAELRRMVSPATDIARSVPVPAVARRASITPVYPGTPSACVLYDSLGGSMVVEDELAYESLSVASATVAAYFDYLRAVSEWLEQHGISTTQARRYVADHFAALGPELLTRDVDFGALAAAHSTSGGLNEQFARHMQAVGTPDAVRSGLDDLLRRITGT
jgi:pyrroline-5-carboxylate reductase